MPEELDEDNAATEASESGDHLGTRGHDDPPKGTSLTNGNDPAHGAGRKGGAGRGGLQDRNGLSNGNERFNDLRQVQKMGARRDGRREAPSKASAGRRANLLRGTSALGLAGTVAGFLWDPINSRDLELKGIGVLQIGMIAGAVLMCIIGIVFLLVPRKHSTSSVCVEAPGRKRTQEPVAKNAT